MKFLLYTAYFCLAFLIFSSTAAAQEIGGVKGKVRNPRGIAIPQVTVLVKQNNQEIRSIVTNTNGEFIIDKLKAGKYSFTFSKTGFTSGTLNNVEIGKNKIRDLGSRLVLDVDEGSLVIIKGTVFDELGYSVFGAKIDISQVLSNGTLRKLDSKFSSESGEFTFRFKDENATYRVTASLKGKSASKDVTVDMAAIYRLALSLDFTKEHSEKTNNIRET